MRKNAKSGIEKEEFEEENWALFEIPAEAVHLNIKSSPLWFHMDFIHETYV